MERDTRCGCELGAWENMIKSVEPLDKKLQLLPILVAYTRLRCTDGVLSEVILVTSSETPWVQGVDKAG